MRFASLFYLLVSIAVVIAVQHVVMTLLGILAMVLMLVWPGILGGALLAYSVSLLPPFLAGMMLIQARPFYRPWLTVPTGSMALLAVILQVGEISWWTLILMGAIHGGLALAGCYVGSWIPRQRRNEALPLSEATG